LQKRPFGLIAIVCYKSFVAALLMITCIALLLALKNYQSLENFANNYVLESKTIIIDWLTEKILNVTPKTLAFSGIGAGIYAVVTAIEAIGLWYEKRWAHILVVGLVAISIPPEIYELIKSISLIKLIVFIVNVVVLWYLVSHFPKHKH
jgi:uncharacterized membrane protein (DUF2068 family)